MLSERRQILHLQNYYAYIILLKKYESTKYKKKFFSVYIRFYLILPLSINLRLSLLLYKLILYTVATHTIIPLPSSLL